MSKISEIISSGCAPGVHLGTTVNPESVYAKVPKALKEMERGERRAKSPQSARDMAKHMGFSVDRLKRTWADKHNPNAFGVILAFLMLVFSGSASQINPGVTFQNGVTYYAQDLNNLILNATMAPAFIYSQPVGTPAGSNDFGIFYSGSGQSLYRATLQSIASSTLNYTLLPRGFPSITNGGGGPDLFSFYSGVNTNVEAITWSNLLASVSSNISVANLSFAATNALSTNTFVPLLPPWSGGFSGFDTNNQPQSLWWGTNGVPYAQSLSNLEISVALDLGTNRSLPYIFTNIFQPWSLYGTNSTTNVWGANTNFPITGLLATNFQGGTNTTLTLLSSDSIPIKSGQQGTNTTVTLGAITSYLTNLNALPSYNQARTIFSGKPTFYQIYTNISVSNSWQLTNSVTNLFVIGTGYGVTLITNGVQMFQNSGSGINGGTTNQIYYIVPTFTNATTMQFQAYTNYSQAWAGTNFITPAVTVPGNLLVYITNFTSFNADATAVSYLPANFQPGYYDIWFRTNSPTPFYYVSGVASGINGNNGPGWFNIIYGLTPLGSSGNAVGGYAPNTAKFRIGTFGETIGQTFATPFNSDLVHLEVHPQ